MDQTPIFLTKFPQFASIPPKKPMLHVKKSLSFPTKLAQNVPNFTNLPKIATFLQETAPSQPIPFENPLFWLVNDELRGTRFLETAQICDFRSFPSRKTLLCEEIKTSRRFLVKYVNLALEVKPHKRRVREALLRRDAENWRKLAGFEEMRPWVPQFLDFFEEKRAFFLCYQEFPLKFLEDTVKHARNHSFPNFQAQILEIYRQLAEFLTKLHDKGLVLLDFRPENFLFDGDRVKLISYELVRPRVLEPSESFEEGNMQFIAPELLNFEEIGSPLDLAKCDYFALGCLILQLLTGKSPRNAEETLGELRGNAGIDEKLAEILENLLKKHPQARKMQSL